MVNRYACPDDGRSDGHGEYLPRAGPGVQWPHHTDTPEDCVALARQYNYSFVQWNAECYNSSAPGGVLARCAADADPTRCAHCTTDECREQCQEASHAAGASNCFAMNDFATGCVWPGPWCYYQVRHPKVVVFGVEHDTKRCWWSARWSPSASRRSAATSGSTRTSTLGCRTAR